jgi:hypothetical protein
MTTSRCPRSRSTRRDPPTPCGLSDTGPGSSGSVPSAYCVASWSSSVGYPSVIPSFLPSPLLLVVVFVRSGCWCVGKYYLYLSLASVVQGLPPAWGLRRTLSERPLEGPVKREKGLGIPLSSHHSEVREALEGTAFAGFPTPRGSQAPRRAFAAFAAARRRARACVTQQQR